MNAPGDILQRIPEFTASLSIKIAPETSVPVTPRLLHIIDSKSFQRLRRIRQLSLSERVFPSATHTRFAHALGVYNNILLYLRRLDRFPAFYEQYDEKDYLAIMLAGLLHDLGHYPCSHQLDHLPAFPKHELLTIAIIKGELQLEGEDLSALIRDHFDLEPERITQLLGPNKDLDPRLRLLKQIIDSPNDADKCDYLPRDSYYCGVDYGSGFDQQRFVGNLIPSNDRSQLCVHEKGLMSAERFQLARYWMYRSVYWGHTVRAFITMLSEACVYLRPIEDEAGWVKKLMTFNDHSFMDWLHEQVEGPGREIIAMAHLQRRPYKRLYTVSSHHHPEHYRTLQDVQLQKDILDWFHRWSAKKGMILKPHYLIWDVPPLYKTQAWETFPIKLTNGKEVPIARESPIIDALSTAFLHGVRKIRLFCHPELSELIKRHKEEVPPIYNFMSLFPPEI